MTIRERVLGPPYLVANGADLTIHGSGEAIGERIILRGQVTDSDGHPVKSARHAEVHG